MNQKSFRESFDKFESSVGEEVSDTELRKFVDFYILALDENIDNDLRDIIDGISLWMDRYGNHDTRGYINQKLDEYSDDKYVVNVLTYLRDGIKS